MLGTCVATVAVRRSSSQSCCGIPLPPPGKQPPTRVGSRPRFLPFAIAAILAAAACSQSSNNQTTAPFDLGMTSTMAAYYSDEELTIYEAQAPVPLPVRAPTASDMSSLGPTPAGTPYPHAPYLTADDESLEVHYTISNIDSTDHTVWMLIDPWNEFVRWNPGVSVVSDEETVPNYGYDLPFLVPALSRIEGTITPDDMHEIAIKLASVENLLASPQAQAAAGDGGMGDDAADDPNAASMAQNAFDATAIANNIMNPQNRSNGKTTRSTRRGSLPSSPASRASTSASAPTRRPTSPSRSPSTCRTSTATASCPSTRRRRRSVCPRSRSRRLRRGSRAPNRVTSRTGLHAGSSGRSAVVPPHGDGISVGSTTVPPRRDGVSVGSMTVPPHGKGISVGPMTCRLAGTGFLSGSTTVPPHGDGISVGSTTVPPRGDGISVGSTTVPPHGDGISVESMTVPPHGDGISVESMTVPPHGDGTACRY